jgi:hypothetical protein
MPQCLNDDTLVLDGIRYPDDPVIVFVLTISILQFAHLDLYGLPPYFNAFW